MDEMAIIEERVRFRGPAGDLTGVLAYPATDQPAGTVLVCSPHPNFAGTMDNNVVRATAQAAARRTVSLRFDYRGVGDSPIALPPGTSVFDYWEQVETRKDYGQAVDDVAAAAAELERLAGSLPMALIGYSFGAVVGLRHACRTGGFRAVVGISPPLAKVGLECLRDCRTPCLLLGGETDFACPSDTLKQLAGQQVTVEILESRDHFFRGAESMLCERAMGFLAAAQGATAAGEP